MDFDLAHEHALLRDSLRRALADPVSPGTGGLWPRCADLGIAALDCRAGADHADDLACMMVAQEEIGRALAVLPFVESIVEVASLLRAGGSPAQREQLLPALEAGRAGIALAAPFVRERYARPAPAITARRHGMGWQLDGRIDLVRGADTASTLVVAATVDGGAGGALFLVPTHRPDVVCTPAPCLDGHGAADLVLRATVVEDHDRIGPPEHGATLVQDVRRMATLAYVAEAVGAMDAVLALTVEYLKTRRQFGRPLGDFQALKHRAADMYVALEQARSMMLYATLAATDADPLARSRAIAAARVQAARSSRFVGQQAIQLHGGIGLAEEYRAGHYVRRLTALELVLGDADDHLVALAADGGLFEPADA